MGPLVADETGEPVPIGGPKAQQVLAVLLAASPRPVPVSTLVDDLWGNRPPATAEHVVSTYVSGLRSVLGERLESTGSRHALVPQPDDVVDLVAVKRAVDRARDLVDSDPAEALTGLRGVPDDDARPFDGLAERSECLAEEARRLTDLLLAATRLRAEALLALGRAGEAEALLAGACRRHPYRERLHGLRMLALYREQRQADALAVYGDLRARLASDLGIEPGTQVRELQDRILMQDAGLLLTPPHDLPAMPQPLVGRDDLLTRLDEMLTGNRLVTLHGPGGIGKTALAVAGAHAALSRFPGGAWFVDLVTVASPARVMGRVRADLAVPAVPGMPDLAVVGTYLADRGALLVLDNCEHLLPDVAGDVGALLERAPDLTVLATSRVPLGIEPETVMPVGPLPGSGARALFLSRARWVPSEHSTDEIDRICSAVDNVPLAIELAAARGDPLARGHRRDTADALDPNGSRHSSMADAIAWSHRLLPPDARDAFDRLCVFAGDFDASAAGSVVDGPDVGATLQVLVEASLIVGAADTIARFRVLQPVRSYGRHRLRERGLLAEVETRHARHYLGLLAAAGQVRLTPSFAGWVPRIQQVEPDLTAALDWALDHLEVPEVAAAAPGLYEYWFRRGDAASAYAFGTRVLAAADASLPPESESAVRLCAGLGGAFVGDVDSATTGLDRGIAVMADSADWRGQVWAVLGRGQNAVVLGDYDTAEAMGHRVLEICRRQDAGPAAAYGYALLGEAEFLRGGDLEQALGHTERAVAGFRLLQDPASLNLFGLGIAAAICTRLGELGKAEAYAVEAATLPGPGWRATALIILGGWVLHAAGDLDRAKRLVRQGALQTHAMSLEPWTRHGCLMLARILTDQGDHERAAVLFGAATPQPPWGADPMWWEPLDVLATSLGSGRLAELRQFGSQAPVGDLLTSLTE